MRAIQAEDYKSDFTKVVPVGSQHLIVAQPGYSLNSCNTQGKKQRDKIYILRAFPYYDDYIRDEYSCIMEFKSIVQAKRYISTVKG